MVIIVIFEIIILQGSVATQLRCGGIRNNQFITNFPQNFENRTLFGEDIDKSMWLSFFWPTLYNWRHNPV